MTLLEYHVEFEFLLIAGNHLVKSFIIGNFVFFLELQKQQKINN